MLKLLLCLALAAGIIATLTAQTDSTASSPEFGRIKSGYYFKSGGLNDYLYSVAAAGKKYDYPVHNFTDEKEYKYKINAAVELSDKVYYDGEELKNGFVGTHKLTASFGENFHVYNETVFDQQLADDPYYSGKKWRNMAAYVRAAFFEYRKDYFKIIFGTLPLDAGPSNFDNLLFSETTQGFNRLHMFLTFDTFSFDTFIGKLDLQGGSNNNLKNISMHRLRFYPSKYLMLKLTETVVYYGQPNWDLMNPFNSYHGLQLNKRIAANSLGTLEIESNVTDNVRLYGAFLLDDYQFDHKEQIDLEPNEIGWQGGISWKNIFTPHDLLEYEYCMITNRTFNAQITGEKFMHGDQYLGHKSGNDFDLHNLKYTSFTKNSSLSGALSFRRKGAGKVESAFTTPWMSVNFDDGYTEDFPTGPVTYTFKAEANYRHYFLKYFDIEAYAGNQVDTYKSKSESNFYGGFKTGFAIDYYKNNKRQTGQ